MAKIGDKDRHRYRELFERLYRLEVIVRERQWDDPVDGVQAQKLVDSTYSQIFRRRRFREIDMGFAQIWSILWPEG